jgi:hypothetical protein
MKRTLKIPSNKSFGIVFITVFLIGIYPLLEQNHIRTWSIFT